jgi:hypothetical protein
MNRPRRPFRLRSRCRRIRSAAGETGGDDVSFTMRPPRQAPRGQCQPGGGKNAGERPIASR